MKEVRRPLIYLAVILPLLCAGGVYLPIKLVSLYAQKMGIPVASVPNTTGLLISLPSIFLWIPISLLIANVILFTVPPLRRIADRYASTAERPGYAKSQQQPLWMLLATAVVCVPLIIYGFNR